MIGGQVRVRELIHIRDPIHGTLPLSPAEIRLVDNPVFQRLRNIKQLGFADLAFPGATHTRYSHSLGAMHIATRLFDRLFGPGDLPERVRMRFRQAVRLAMLFHDVGHAPLSHTSECLMPPVGELGLGGFAGTDVSRQATHEDYTLKMVLDSELGEQVRSSFHEEGLDPTDIADLILGAAGREGRGRFRHGGVDFAPLLSQLVSSECDADRMDYLQRDSFFSGVNYGKFDADWLIDNVAPVQKDGQVFLGIKSRAMFSFEDFLLSRYHMFASVYLHYTPVIFEQMLKRYFEESGSTEFDLPADVEKYASLDDMDLWVTLRRSKNPWAKRIVERRAFSLLDERHDDGRLSGVPVDHLELVRRLEEKSIEVIHTRSRSILSKYYGNQQKNPIFVVTPTQEHVSLDAFTPLYERYQSPATLSRVYCQPDQRKEARVVLNQYIAELKVEAQQAESQRTEAQEGDTPDAASEGEAQDPTAPQAILDAPN